MIWINRLFISLDKIIHVNFFFDKILLYPLQWAILPKEAKIFQKKFSIH